MKQLRHPTSVWLHYHRGRDGRRWWRCRWRDPMTGRLCSESCGTDLALARIRRVQIIADLRNRVTGRLEPVPISQLAERLPTLMAGRASRTMDEMRCSLRHLIAVVGDGPIQEIDRGQILAFRASRLEAGLSLATVNKDARQIRAALTAAVDAGLLHANPLLGWRGLLLREPQRSVRVVEEHEFAQLLAACEDPMFRALLIVAYRQGLRRGELGALRWDAVDLERRVLHVLNRPGEPTKDRHVRALPLHPHAERQLAAMWLAAPKIIETGRIMARSPHVFCWPDGRPYQGPWIGKRFARLVREAAIDHCTIHDLRRSFVTLALRAGVDAVVVQGWAGHSSMGVTQRHYIGEIGALERREMAKLGRAWESTA